MGMSFSHLLIILLIILVLFGAGKLPQVMADLGKGLRAFKSGLNSSEDKKENKEDL
ncbi:MAG: twin-arginine translocase TatA/TatE family subunit [Janthinobacterium lividum]